MEPQQPNPLEKTSNGYTKLNNNEVSSLAQPSSCNQEKPQENPLDVHQRTSISGQKDSNSSSEGLLQNKIKELDSCFSIFYKVILALFIWISALGIIFMIFEGLDGLGFDKFAALSAGWLLVQCFFAFSGVRRRDLRKISIAFSMMKWYYLLLGLTFVNEEAKAHKKSSRRQEEGSASKRLLGIAIISILYTITLFLPTWKVRNFLKTLPDGYNNAKEEEIRKEQAQGPDPIERLDSLWFTMYRYGLLLSICVQVKILVSDGLEDFSDGPRFFNKISAQSSFLVTSIIRYFAVPLRFVFMCLTFEGIRRKNLEKVLAAIKLMKVMMVAELLLQAMKGMVLSREGKFMEEDKKILEALEIDSLPLLFVFGMVLIGLTYYFVYIYVALKVRNILKAHQEVKRTL